MKIENFCCVAAELQNKMTQSTLMSQMYYYRAFEDETLAEMQEVGFFNDAFNRVKVDDIIILYEPSAAEGTPRFAWVKIINKIGGIVTTEPMIVDYILYQELETISKELENFSDIYTKTKPRLTGYLADNPTPDMYLGTDGLIHIENSFKIVFNKKIYYAENKDDLETITFSPRNIPCPNFGVGNSSAFYLVAYIDGTISIQTTKPKGKEGGIKCLLASGFAYISGSNWIFQQGSFVFEPWVSISDQSTRELDLPLVGGGKINLKSNNTVSIEEYRLSSEGVNFANDRSNPNIISFPSADPATYKYIYPGYNIDTPTQSTLLNDKVYDTISGNVNTISSTDKYMILVPMFTETGQRLIPMPQGQNVGGQYTCVFNTYQQALANIYEQTYDLTGLSPRLKHFGVSFIVKTNMTGATSSPENFVIVNQVPKQFQDFFTSGQGGGDSNLSGMTIFDKGTKVSGLNAINELDFNGFGVRIPSSNRAAIDIIKSMPTNTNMNTLLSNGFYSFTVGANINANQPVVGTGAAEWLVRVVFDSVDIKMQIAESNIIGSGNFPASYKRRLIDGAWSAWERIDGVNKVAYSPDMTGKDWNNIKAVGFYGTNVPANVNVNQPAVFTGGSDWYLIVQSRGNSTTYLVQTAVSVGGQVWQGGYPAVWERRCNNGTWEAWVRTDANATPEIISISGTTMNFATNKIYKSSISAATTFTPPTLSDWDKKYHNQIKMYLGVTGTPAVNWGTTEYVNDVEPDVSTGQYEVFWDWNPNKNKWVCGALRSGA